VPERLNVAAPPTAFVVTQDSLDKHLPGLLGAAGKAIALSPQAKARVAELRHVEDREAFLRYLAREEVDLGVDQPAVEAIREAAGDEARWKDTHAALLRSAEQQLTERFHSSA
jgi:hypothetical protein